MSDTHTVWIDKGEKGAVHHEGGGHHEGSATPKGLPGKLAASFKKHKRIWLIGIGCAVVLGLYLLFKSGRSSHADDDALYTASPVDDSYSSDSSTGGSGGSGSADPNDYITPEQFRDTLGTLSGSINDAFSKQQDAWKDQMDDLQSQITDARYTSSPWSSLPYDMDYSQAPDIPEVHNDLATGVYTPTSNPAAVTPTDLGNPYFGTGGANYNTSDKAVRQSLIDNTLKLQNDPSYRASEIERTRKVMNDRVAAGMDISEQNKYMEQITTAQYGNNGANYKNLTTAEQKKMSASTQRLNSDAGYRETELARTNAIIAERKAAGMDTSAQDKYKAEINKASSSKPSTSTAKASTTKATTTAKSSTSKTTASTSNKAAATAKAAAEKKAAEAKAAAAKKAAADKAAKAAAEKKAAAAKAEAAKKAAASKAASAKKATPKKTITKK